MHIVQKNLSCTGKRNRTEREQLNRKRFNVWHVGCLNAISYSSWTESKAIKTLVVFGNLDDAQQTKSIFQVGSLCDGVVFLGQGSRVSQLTRLMFCLTLWGLLELRQ